MMKPVGQTRDTQIDFVESRGKWIVRLLWDFQTEIAASGVTRTEVKHCYWQGGKASCGPGALWLGYWTFNRGYAKEFRTERKARAEYLAKLMEES